MTTRVNCSVTVSKVCKSLDAGITPRGRGKLNITKSALVDSFLIKLFNPIGGSFCNKTKLIEVNHKFISIKSPMFAKIYLKYSKLLSLILLLCLQPSLFLNFKCKLY